MPELSSLLIEINNSIQKENFFNNNNENLNYFYKAFDIFFSLTNFCIEVHFEVLSFSMKPFTEDNIAFFDRHCVV